MPDATAGSSVDRIPCSTATDSGNSRGSGYSSTTVFRSGMSAPRAGGGNGRRARIRHRQRPAETCTYRGTHVKPPAMLARSTYVSEEHFTLRPASLAHVLGPRSNRRRFFGALAWHSDDDREDLAMSDWLVIGTTVVIGYLIRLFVF